MSWRYQPVIIDDTGRDYLMLCECYFDDNHRLEKWTDPGIEAGGATIKHLSTDLCRMLVDAVSWVPVKAADLKVGMELQPALSIAQREALAKFTEAIAHNFNV